MTAGTVALTSQDLLTLGLVVGILLAVMLYNTMAAARRPHTTPAAMSSSVAAPQPWVGRYLQHEGDVVGQVIAVEDGRVIVRKGANHLSLARGQVREQGLDLGTTGPYDPTQAAVDGAAWKSQHPEA